jgi:hypothetical protein
MRHSSLNLTYGTAYFQIPEALTHIGAIVFTVTGAEAAEYPADDPLWA